VAIMHTLHKSNQTTTSKSHTDDTKSGMVSRLLTDTCLSLFVFQQRMSESAAYV